VIGYRRVKGNSDVGTVLLIHGGTILRKINPPLLN